ncbi:MAG: tRNA uridine(34) 5-carboxymethylaminomethyl modification radical SAM/GNAT enzyme Elp3 [Thermoplasmatales archaeon]|nr:tRNA uridine(34) 5-carboxymethylaminomethyl modification radical SAM/GNAT enzyme Elp3 [Thermoplasmatales archaeon]
MNPKIYQEIISEILTKKPVTKNGVHKIKLQFCRKYNLDKVPSDADILSNVDEDFYPFLEPVLRMKPVRTISGVAVVAVMSSPAECPHGKCSYCPGGVEYGSAQSYTGKEPAALRAGMHNFDPFLQTKSRIEQLNIIGHPTDKIDLIVMGGTFTSRNIDYQNFFVKSCFDAMNDKESKNLEEAQKINENAKHRCIGLTIETRPDWCKKEHVDQILRLGGTRVELGVQSTFDAVLRNVERGHRVQASIDATRILKDSGLKVCYHMMPGLPGSSKEMDLESFKKIFYDEKFRPDMLKIYPTLVIQGTKLYDSWKNKGYKALTTDEAAEIITEVKRIVPRWVRIQRIQRDIPVPLIDDGVKKSNLRQIVEEKMKKIKIKCNCIRCREVGHKMLKGIMPDVNNIKLLRMDYGASGGKEIFLSFEDLKKDILIGYARLRKPGKPHRKEIKDCILIRELKVFGQMVPIGEKPEYEWQHRGYGKELMKECELITKKEFGCKKILVNSGAGARNYYRKLGYRKNGVYMGRVL